MKQNNYAKINSRHYFHKSTTKSVIADLFYKVTGQTIHNPFTVLFRRQKNHKLLKTLVTVVGTTQHEQVVIRSDPIIFIARNPYTLTNQNLCLLFPLPSNMFQTTPLRYSLHHYSHPLQISSDT